MDHYNVFIRVEKSDPCRWLYAMFAEGAVAETADHAKCEPVEVSEQPLLLLSGDQLESDGHYVRLRVTVPEPYAGLVVWLPHRVVVLVTSDDRNRTIAFGAAQN